MDYQSLNNESQSKPKALNKKGIIIAGISLVIIAILIITITVSLKNSTPSKEQLQEDLIHQKLDDENLSISDFTIYSENKSDNKYTAVASVTYEKENVEYNEKYLLSYSKYDEWQFCDVEDYDKNLWTKKPTAAPDIKDYQGNCKMKLYNDGEFSDYDVFEPNISKTKEDLDSGTVIFVFDVEKNSKVETISGEIEFLFSFDSKYGKWEIDSYSYCDSYTISYNLLNSWSGTGHDMDNENKPVEEKFALKITSYENKETKAILTIDNQEVIMTGTIILPESAGDQFDIDLVNTDKKLHVDAVMTIDGEIYATIDTAYNPDAHFYRFIDRYDVDLFIE